MAGYRLSPRHRRTSSDAARLDEDEDDFAARHQAAFEALDVFRMQLRADASAISSVEFIRRDRDAEVHGHWGELADPEPE